MVTRLKTRNEASRWPGTTFRGTWTSTASSVTRRMSLTKAGTAVGNVAFNNSSNNVNLASLRLVSDALSGAQSISGTLQLCLDINESNAAQNGVWRVHAYVSQGDTDTVRGTLLANYTDGTEFATSQTPQSLDAAQTLSSVSASDGDRIIVELGWHSTNGGGIASSVATKYGGTGADCVAAGASGGTGWVEFSQDLTFKPTYLFLNDHAAPASATTPSAFQGAWDDTAGAVTKQLSVDKTDSGVLTTVARAETNASSTYDVCLYRGISQQLATQSISGSVDIAIGLTESSTSADMTLHLHIYVMKSDGTVRGTLLADYVESVLGTDEWTTSQGTSGRQLLTVQTLSTVSATAGDRLVVEIGYIARNSVTTSFTGTLIYGGIAGPDGSHDEGEVISGGSASTVSTNYAGYIVFLSGLTFVPPTVRVSQEVVEVVILPDNQMVRVSQLVTEVIVPSPPATGPPSQSVVAI